MSKLKNVKKMRLPFLLIAFSLCMTACREKTVTAPAPTGANPMAIYALKSFSTVTLNGFKIDESTVVLQDTPLVAYKDIVSYGATSHVMTLTEAGKKAIQNLEQSGIRKAFAIKAKNTVVYTGYFWSSIMSSTCDWTVMDIIDLPTQKTLKVQLGYPSDLFRATVPDRRSDNRIFDILRADNKLLP
jgi:hypothetical protein